MCGGHKDIEFIDSMFNPTPEAPVGDTCDSCSCNYRGWVVPDTWTESESLTNTIHPPTNESAVINVFPTSNNL